MATENEQPQGWLGKVQDFFNRVNNVSVPVTPYTAARIEGISQSPVSDFIDKTAKPITNFSRDYQAAGGGATGLGAALRGDYDRTVDWTSRNIIEPSYSDTSQAFKPYIDLARPVVNGVVTGFSKGPEQIAKENQLKSQAVDATQNSLPATVPPAEITPQVATSTTESNDPSRLVGNYEVNNRGLQGYMTDSAMDRRRAAEQAAVRPLMGNIAENAKLVRQAQLDSDYNRGVINNPNSIPINVTAGTQRTLAPIFADPSKQVGTAQFSSGTPFEPSMGLSAPPMDKEFNGKRTDMPLWTKRVMSSEGATTGPMTVGGSDVPLYETNYRDKDGKVIATITGQNQRVGGGTLSVIGGRTPEEQAAIDANVASIDKQTAAMRSLRNANRQAQGLPTVEQEEQTAAMRDRMNQLAPPPNLSGLNEQRANLMQQLQGIDGIQGRGKREAALKAVMGGLSELDRQEANARGMYQQQAGLAQHFLQNQTASARNAQENYLNQLKFMAERGDQKALQAYNQEKLRMEQAQLQETARSNDLRAEGTAAGLRQRQAGAFSKHMESAPSMRSIVESAKKSNDPRYLTMKPEQILNEQLSLYGISPKDDQQSEAILNPKDPTGQTILVRDPKTKQIRPVNTDEYLQYKHAQRFMGGGLYGQDTEEQQP